MTSYYRICFNIDNKVRYLAWAHGSFYITHIEIYARLFTTESLANIEVKEFLDDMNQSYYFEEIKDEKEIKKRFIYSNC